MEERPAPVVSISDPARPGTPGDVLSAGSERDPWRPRRGHVRAGALVLALVAAAVVPGKVVAARAQDRRAATAAADAVLLAVAPGAPELLGVVLENDGPTGVRLVDVRVQAPGYRRVAAHGALAAHSTVTVALRDTRTCGEQLLTDGGPGSLEVRARTAAGRLLTRTVVLSPDAWTDLVDAAQRRCGYQSPERALTTSVTVQKQGRRLLVRLQLHNRDRVPLLLQSVVDPVGSTVTVVGGAGLPVTVPAGQDRELTVTLVPGCLPADVEGEPLLALQVQPVLSGYDGQPATVEVLGPGGRQQVAALRPACTGEATAG